jgi:hypothetical protein
MSQSIENGVQELSKREDLLQQIGLQDTPKNDRFRLRACPRNPTIFGMASTLPAYRDAARKRAALLEVGLSAGDN